MVTNIAVVSTYPTISGQIISGEQLERKIPMTLFFVSPRQFSCSPPKVKVMDERKQFSYFWMLTVNNRGNGGKGS